MKFFASILPTVGLVAALALGVAADLTVSEATKAIDDITTEVTAFTTQLKRINANNVGREGESVVEDLRSLTGDITAQVIFLTKDESPQFNDKDATEVLESYQGTVAAIEKLVQTLNNDHDLFAKNGLVDDIVDAFRPFRAADMQILGALKSIAESRSDDIMNTFSGLNDVFEEFIQLYEDSP